MSFLMEKIALKWGKRLFFSILSKLSINFGRYFVTSLSNPFLLEVCGRVVYIFLSKWKNILLHHSCEKAKRVPAKFSF